jgi:surface protein
MGDFKRFFRYAIVFVMVACCFTFTALADPTEEAATTDTGSETQISESAAAEITLKPYSAFLVYYPADSDGPTVLPTDYTWENMDSVNDETVYYSHTVEVDCNVEMGKASDGLSLDQLLLHISETALTEEELSTIDTWSYGHNTIVNQGAKPTYVYFKAVFSDGTIKYAGTPQLIVDTCLPEILMYMPEQSAYISELVDGAIYPDDILIKPDEAYETVFTVNGSEPVLRSDGTIDLSNAGNTVTIEIGDHSGFVNTYTIYLESDTNSDDNGINVTASDGSVIRAHDEQSTTTTFALKDGGKAIVEYGSYNTETKFLDENGLTTKSHKYENGYLQSINTYSYGDNGTVHIETYKPLAGQTISSDEYTDGLVTNTWTGSDSIGSYTCTQYTQAVFDSDGNTTGSTQYTIYTYADGSSYKTYQSDSEDSGSSEVYDANGALLYKITESTNDKERIVEYRDAADRLVLEKRFLLNTDGVGNYAGFESETYYYSDGTTSTTTATKEYFEPITTYTTIVKNANGETTSKLTRVETAYDSKSETPGTSYVLTNEAGSDKTVVSYWMDPDGTYKLTGLSKSDASGTTYRAPVSDDATASSEITGCLAEKHAFVPTTLSFESSPVSVVLTNHDVTLGVPSVTWPEASPITIVNSLENITNRGDNLRFEVSSASPIVSVSVDDKELDSTAYTVDETGVMLPADTTYTLTPARHLVTVAFENGLTAETHFRLKNADGDSHKTLRVTVYENLPNHNELGIFTSLTGENADEIKSNKNLQIGIDLINDAGYYCDGSIYYHISEQPIDTDQLDDLDWTERDNGSWNIDFSNQTGYVYIKAEDADGNVYFASTPYLLGDTDVPRIYTGTAYLESGLYYSDEADFEISEQNLESVLINGAPVSVDESGKISLAGRSGETNIKLIDAAGNQRDYRIYVVPGLTTETHRYDENGDETEDWQSVATQKVDLYDKDGSLVESYVFDKNTSPYTYGPNGTYEIHRNDVCYIKDSSGRILAIDFYGGTNDEIRTYEYDESGTITVTVSSQSKNYVDVMNPDGTGYETYDYTKEDGSGYHQINNYSYTIGENELPEKTYGSTQYVYQDGMTKTVSDSTYDNVTVTDKDGNIVCQKITEYHDGGKTETIYENGLIALVKEYESTGDWYKVTNTKAYTDYGYYADIAEQTYDEDLGQRTASADLYQYGSLVGNITSKFYQENGDFTIDITKTYNGETMHAKVRAITENASDFKFVELIATDEYGRTTSYPVGNIGSFNWYYEYASSSPIMEVISRNVSTFDNDALSYTCIDYGGTPYIFDFDFKDENYTCFDTLSYPASDYGTAISIGTYNNSYLSEVKVDGTPVEYQIDSNYLVIPRSIAMTLTPGTHTIELVSSNGISCSREYTINDVAISATGELGTAPWTLDENGTLTIGSGTFSWTELSNFLRTSEQKISHLHFLDGSKVYGDGTDALSNLNYDTNCCLRYITGNLDTSETTSMKSLFAKDYELKDISGLASWNTSSVVSFENMFYNCYYIDDFSPISSFNTTNATNIASMFESTHFDDADLLGSWNVSNVTNMSQTFANTDINPNGESFANWDVSNVTNFESIFRNCDEITSLGFISNLHIPANATLDYAFSGTSIKTLAGLEQLNPSSFSSIKGMFSNCAKLSDISAIKDWNTSNLESLDNLFYECSSLANLDALRNWDVSNVTSMDYIFRDCTQLADISGLENWDVSNVASMAYAFGGCSSLKTAVAWGNWNVTDADNMGLLGYYYSSDISRSAIESTSFRNWDLKHSSSYYSENMLGQLTNLQSIELGENWAFVRNLCLPDISANTTDTGKWVSSDALVGGPYTSQELKDYWDGNYMAGTWIREKIADTYTIVLDSNDGSGNQTVVTADTNASYRIPNDAATRSGYVLTGWSTSGNGESILDEYGCVRGIGQAGDTITLYAQWTKLGSNERAGLFGTQNVSWQLDSEGNLTIGHGKFTWLELEELLATNNKAIKHVDFKGCLINADTTDGYSYYDSAEAFSDMPYLESVTGKLDIANTTDLRSLFSNCPNLTDISALERWDVSHVSSLNNLFYNCKSLNDITPISNWQFNNLDIVGGLFQECSALTDARAISSWDLSNVDSCRNMFEDCSNLKYIDASQWNLSISALKDSYGMFSGCYKIEKITLGSNWYFFDNMSFPEQLDDQNQYYWEDQGAFGGHWSSEDATDSSHYASNEFVDAWDPATMAGTWTRSYEGNEGIITYDDNVENGYVIDHYVSDITTYKLTHPNSGAENQAFIGWTTSADGTGEIYKYDSTYTGDFSNHAVTLYAKFVPTIYNAKITGLEDALYSGASYKPKPTVTLGDVVLEEGTDYTVAYPDDTINAGVKTIEITGTGEYYGKASASYTINKRKVVLTSASAEKPYDGTVLSSHTVTVEGDGFVAGEAMAYAPNEISGVGQVVNTIGVTILSDAYKPDNYTIEKHEGMLKVTGDTSQTVSGTSFVVSKPADVLYDGKVHTNEPTVTKADGTKLVKDTDYTLSYSDNRTDAGLVTVTVTGKGDYSGSQTTSYTITPRTVRLTTESAAKVYDGTELAKHDVKVEGDGFVNGEAIATAPTAITDAGSATNEIVIEGSYNPNNYDIVKSEGMLSVARATLEAGKLTDVTYDGKAHDETPAVTNAAGAELVEKQDYTIARTGDTTNAGTVTYTVTGVGNYTGTATVSFNIAKRTVVLVSMSASKIYDGEALEKPYVQIGGDGFVPGEATATATGSITDCATEVSNTIAVSGTYNPDNYNLMKIEGSLSVTPASFSVAQMADVLYDGTAHADEPVATGANGLTLAKGTDYTLSLEGDTTNANTVTYTLEGTGNYAGTATTSFAIKPRTVILTSDSATKVYDGTALTAPGVKVEGDGFVPGEATAEANASLVEAGNKTNEITIVKGTDAYNENNYVIVKNEGVLRVNEPSNAVFMIWEPHDVMYDGTDQKQEIKVTDWNGNPLTEGIDYNVTYKGDTTNAGVVTVTVTGAGIYGEGEKPSESIFTYRINKRKVKLTSQSATRTYNGTALTVPDVKVEGDGFVEGEATAKATGTITNVGSTRNTIEISGYYNPDNYVITTSEGYLNIDAAAITVGKLKSVTYDGKKHELEPVVTNTAGETLVKDKDYTLSYIGDTTNVGQVNVKVVGMGNYGDILYSAYDILKRSVTLTTQSAEKTYDGTPLSAPKVTIAGDGFVSGEATATAETTLTDAGSVKNAITVETSEAYNEDNYDIKTTEGTLTVKKRSVTLATQSASKTYDGTPLSAPKVTVGGDGFVSGEATATAKTSLTDAGSAKNAITVETAGSYKASNYDVTKTEGTLTVSKRKVTLASQSVSKKYDGAALTAASVTVGGDGFVSGEAVAKATGSVKDAGSATNAIQISGTYKASNYDISKTEGTLTVTRRSVTLTSQSTSKTYDGKALTSPAVTVSGDGFVSGEASAKAIGSVTNPGSATNTISVQTSGSYKASNYDVTKKEGTLTVSVPATADVAYRTHVQNVGWQNWATNGATAGTSGKALRLEGINVKLQNAPVSGGITYRTHIQNVGWQEWKSDGAMSGTSGRALRLEAIQIKLTGRMAEEYDVYYRVHAQNVGWMGWAKNGEAAGTAGYAYRLEAIQIKVVKKGSAAPGSTANAFIGKMVQYRSHVQSIGWQNYVNQGETSGTSGRGLRLEAMNLRLASTPYSGGITYRTHVQNIGWQNWVSDGAMTGTSGRALRLEAISIKLTGEMANHFDVYYRVHAQSFGWMGWAKNGQDAGTAGYAYRLEAIQVVLVPKGGAAPGSTANAFRSK